MILKKYMCGALQRKSSCDNCLLVIVCLPTNDYKQTDVKLSSQLTKYGMYSFERLITTMKTLRESWRAKSLSLCKGGVRVKGLSRRL